MKRRACRSFAIASFIALAAIAATRPRYGGTLRIQLSGPHPVFKPAERTLSLRDRALLELIAETLTRLNARGEPEPLLATSWQSDAEKKRWRFTLRSGVQFHDGTPLTPAAAAGALRSGLTAEVTSFAQGVQISTDRPMPDLPVRLADSALAIVREGANLIATGPFQISEPGAGVVMLNAFEQHWAGRPFLDAIELMPYLTSRAPASAADAWEIPAGAPRRAFPERLQMWTSAPAELLAIELNPADPNLAAALSAAVDRQSMAAVLTQRRAEASAAVLPQWVSGYSFVFNMARDLAKARQLLPNGHAAPMVLSYDAADVLARAVAERVAVNARDAGIVITPRPDTSAPLRLRRLYAGPNTLEAGLPTTVIADTEDMHAAEKTVLESGKLIPLMHVPLVFGFSQKVRLPAATAPVLPRLPLESAWMTP